MKQELTFSFLLPILPRTLLTLPSCVCPCAGFWLFGTTSFWGKSCEYAHFLICKLILLSISFAYSSASLTSTQATPFLPAKIFLLSLSPFPTLSSTVFRIKTCDFPLVWLSQQSQLKICPHHYWWLSFPMNCNTELFSNCHPNCYPDLMKWFLCFDATSLFSTKSWGLFYVLWWGFFGFGFCFSFFPDEYTANFAPQSPEPLFVPLLLSWQTYCS